MQNIAVATYPDNFNPADHKPAAKAAHDFFLDPLPVPEATESSTDTAWGLWEHSVQTYEVGAHEPADNKQPDFEDTEVSDVIPPQDKP